MTLSFLFIFTAQDHF